MRTISAMTNRVKLYSTSCYAANLEVVDYAAKHRMKVALGLYISKNDKSNALEVDALKLVLKKYGKSNVITDIVIGNEPILVAGASLAQLLDIVAKVRSVVKASGAGRIAIGTAEIEQVWKGQDIDSPTVGKVKGIDMVPLIKKLDWIGLNLHSYYASYDPLLGEAAAYVHNVSLGMNLFLANRSVNRPVIVTETGYPTSGQPNMFGGRVATPSVKGLEAFLIDMETSSRKFKLPVCMSSWYIQPHVICVLRLALSALSLP
jgi:exo-beta-1,3-glucanase (GH17 family)